MLSKLQVGWPKVEITDEVIEFYEMGLGDVPLEIAMEAAKRHVRGGSPFFPTVSELRGVIAKEALGDIVPEAVWSEIRREAVRHPYGVAKIFDPSTNKTIKNPGPSFSHPLIAAAVEATGWQLLCQAENETEIKEQFTWTLKRLTEKATTDAKISSMADLVQPESPLAPGNVRKLRDIS